MPRGQTKQLAPAWENRRIWNHPTAAMRLPVITERQSKAIAQWADKQDDPVGAMQQILDWIESRDK